jgi:hypothetical protein
LTIECTEPEETALFASDEAGVDEEVRQFRAAIVGEWAAQYARRRKASGGGEPSPGAFADLRRWAHARLTAPRAPEREEEPTPVDAEDVQAA